jgi:hypothetical protein
MTLVETFFVMNVMRSGKVSARLKPNRFKRLWYAVRMAYLWCTWSWDEKEERLQKLLDIVKAINGN